MLDLSPNGWVWLLLAFRRPVQRAPEKLDTIWPAADLLKAFP